MGFFSNYKIEEDYDGFIHEYSSHERLLDLKDRYEELQKNHYIDNSYRLGRDELKSVLPECIDRFADLMIAIDIVENYIRINNLDSSLKNLDVGMNKELYVIYFTYGEVTNVRCIKSSKN